MKKLLLLVLGVMLAQIAMSQRVVVLDLPNPCAEIGVEEWSSEGPTLVFDVYPNPTDDNVTLSVSTTKDALGKMSVQVFDLSGRVLLKKEYYSAHDKMQSLFEMEALESGVYIINLRNAEGAASKRVIKK